MKLGDMHLQALSGGSFGLDGGAMFGVVPRPLWTRVITPDDRNRIPMQTNCLLVQHAGKTILIETGYGGKLSEKEREIYASQSGNPLVENLVNSGVTPEQIDLVILTHLHFDHAGGGVIRNPSGELVPTFPRAEYVAQRREWMFATAELPELAGMYPLENLRPLKDHDQLRLIDGEGEITPGIWAIPTPGHTQGHHSILLTSGGDSAVFLGDVCPTFHHLPTLWCMSYDIDLMEVRRSKKRILGQIADGNWWAISGHDAGIAAAKLERDSRKDFVTTETRTLQDL